MEKLDTRETMTLSELEGSIKTMIPDLSIAAEKPAHPNPFLGKINFTKFDKIQVLN